MAKQPSKFAQAKDIDSALDDAEGWGSGSAVPLPKEVIKTIGHIVEIEIGGIIEDHPLQRLTASFDPEHNPKQAALLNSIKTHGVKIPICVKEIASGQYRIVYGHKRVICATRAHLRTIPAVIADADVNDSILHLLENLFRSEPTTYENAVAASTLLMQDIRPGQRYSRQQVAAIFEWSPDWLDQILDVLSSPEPLHAFFRAGTDIKLLRQVWVQVRKSGLDETGQNNICQSLVKLGINSLEPFVLFTRDHKIPALDAIKKIESTGLSQPGDHPQGQGAVVPPVALTKKPGRPTGSRGSTPRVAQRLASQKLWDPIWLQKNGEDGKELLIRTTGIASTKADKLVFGHAVGTGASLGLTVLAALAIIHPQSSSKSLDEKKALEFAKRLHDGSSKLGRKLTEQYMATLAMLPDMLGELQKKDPALNEFAASVFGVRATGSKSKSPKSSKGGR